MKSDRLGYVLRVLGVALSKKGIIEVYTVEYSKGQLVETYGTLQVYPGGYQVTPSP